MNVSSDAVRLAECGVSAIRVFVALRSRDRGGDGYCWPSYEWLSQATQLSTRSIMRCIDRLYKAGVLDVAPLGRHAEGQKQNLYRLEKRIEPENLPERLTRTGLYLLPHKIPHKQRVRKDRGDN